MTQFEEILRGLVAHHIDFVLVGGLAGVAHGSAYITSDLDIAYSRASSNIKRLVTYLRSIHAKLRGVPGDLPFVLDEKTFSFTMNFTFQTDLGDLDLLGEMAGVSPYAEVLKYSEVMNLYNMQIKVLSIDGLIQAKKAAGRPKDQMHLQELLALRAKKKQLPL